MDKTSVFDTYADPDVGWPGQHWCNFGEAVGPLRQHLEHMLVRGRHDVEYLRDKFEWDRLMGEVAPLS